MEKRLCVERMLNAITQLTSFRELARFMDRVILENMEVFNNDHSKSELAEILARMYSQGGEVALHDEYNRGDANKAMMKLILETMGCLRTFNPIRGGHHFAQIPKVFTQLRQLDDPCVQLCRIYELEEDTITWSSTDLLLTEILNQGHFVNLCQLVVQICEETENELTEEILLRIEEVLARAYSQGGELSLMMEIGAGNGDIMTVFRQSETCFPTRDAERCNGVFYQFPEIFSPHRILGVPTEPRL